MDMFCSSAPSLMVHHGEEASPLLAALCHKGFTISLSLCSSGTALKNVASSDRSERLKTSPSGRDLDSAGQFKLGITSLPVMPALRAPPVYHEVMGMR